MLWSQSISLAEGVQRKRLRGRRLASLPPESSQGRPDDILGPRGFAVAVGDFVNAGAANVEPFGILYVDHGSTQSSALAHSRSEG